MIVTDFDVVGLGILPTEAYTPLVIDANGILSGSVAWNP
jgi:hypothetical protein